MALDAMYVFIFIDFLLLMFHQLGLVLALPYDRMF